MQEEREIEACIGERQRDGASDLEADALSIPHMAESARAVSTKCGVRSTPITRHPYRAAIIRAVPPMPEPMSSTSVSERMESFPRSAAVASAPPIWNSSTGFRTSGDMASGSCPSSDKAARIRRARRRMHKAWTLRI